MDLKLKSRIKKVRKKISAFWSSRYTWQKWLIGLSIAVTIAAMLVSFCPPVQAIAVVAMGAAIVNICHFFIGAIGAGIVTLFKSKAPEILLKGKSPQAERRRSLSATVLTPIQLSPIQTESPLAKLTPSKTPKEKRRLIESTSFYLREAIQRCDSIIQSIPDLLKQRKFFFFPHASRDAIKKNDFERNKQVECPVNSSVFKTGHLVSDPLWVERYKAVISEAKTEKFYEKQVTFLNEVLALGKALEVYRYQLATDKNARERLRLKLKDEPTMPLSSEPFPFPEVNGLNAAQFRYEKVSHSSAVFFASPKFGSNKVSPVPAREKALSAPEQKEGEGRRLARQLFY